MTCEEVVLHLDEAQQNEAAVSQEAGAHLAECAGCAAYATFLAQLRTEVAALPRSLAPSRDLWADIEQQIAKERVVPITRFRTAAFAPWLAAAAALIVGVGAGMWWMKTQPASNTAPTQVATAATPASSAPSPTASAPEPASSAPASAIPVAAQPNATAAAWPASYETGAAEFTRATADLRSALAARKDTMTPETRAVVEKNLAVIDTALRDIESALRKDPNNSDLVRMLGAMRKRKIETLQLVVKLTA